MDFNISFTPRSAAVQGGSDNEAGIMVIVMMGLVFVPIVIAHAVAMLPDASGDQLASMFSALLKTF